MKIFGVAGWSGSGKTTLVTALIPVLVARGVSVSTVKHAHHDFDIDKPGKDSHRHREAGASEVLVASGRRWALMHELRDAPEPTLDELIAHLSPVDLVLVEASSSIATPNSKCIARVSASRCLPPRILMLPQWRATKPCPGSVFRCSG
jgi:molybdopterin-guanine dinucleotide biosynthesis protein MobB